MTGARISDRAGFGQRLLAAIIDGLIMAAVSTVLMAIFGGDRSFTEADPTESSIQFLLGLGYYIYFHGSASGQTVGKKVMNIRVVGFEDGGPIGYGRAALRYVGSIISAIPCFLGYFWMLWDNEKQTWHDKFASSVVVPTAAAPVAKWPG
jgi:uncharacterized RDD family membrane protein YckC